MAAIDSGLVYGRLAPVAVGWPNAFSGLFLFIVGPIIVFRQTTPTVPLKRNQPAIWDPAHRITRITPAQAWGVFCNDSQIRGDVSGLLGRIESSIRAAAQPNPGSNGCVVEWRPDGFTLRRADRQLGFKSIWIAPRISKMANVPIAQWVVEYTAGEIALVGGLAKDSRGGPSILGSVQ